MNKSDKIFVAGATGMVGAGIIRNLQKKGFENIVGTYHSRKPQNTSIKWAPLDLLDQQKVSAFYKAEKPEVVFDAAAKVGGIVANNTYRGQFLYENLVIQNNVIHSAYEVGVKKLMFLGSSCIYPKFAPQPMKEEHLLTGTLEYTNEPYAIAKIAGLKMCENYNKQYGTNYIAAMPTNLYGPGDSYDLKNSHVLPALIRKFHEAKMTRSDSVEIWGTGTPMREFMHVDDLAEALIYLMENYDGETFVNIGWGEDISIKDLALTIKDIIGFEGDLKFDSSKPDGTPRKLLDTSLLNNLGFKPTIKLSVGIEDAYNDFLKNVLKS